MVYYFFVLVLCISSLYHLFVRLRGLLLGAPGSSNHLSENFDVGCTMKNKSLRLSRLQDKIGVIQDLLRSFVVVDPETHDSFLPQTEEVAALVGTLAELVQLESRILARGNVIPIDEYFQGAGDPEGSL